PISRASAARSSIESRSPRSRSKAFFKSLRACPGSKTYRKAAAMRTSAATHPTRETNTLILFSPRRMPKRCAEKIHEHPTEHEKSERNSGVLEQALCRLRRKHHGEP